MRCVHATLDLFKALSLRLPNLCARGVAELQLRTSARLFRGNALLAEQSQSHREGAVTFTFDLAT